ncbi:MAG: UDP-glucose/GDP-mannose dehydrogenase family protein [Gemmatimonadetes bacterium]|nr:UDP-glucose/GDP-mannose dehydrogenase family protein [Gemmatimonadota bacterium]
MNVGVIGTGYVGLVVGACLAETGNDVVCADIDPEKIRKLSAGDIPIYEPGLEPLLRRNLATGRLRFTTSVAEAARASTVIFIAVGTPPHEDGSADLQHVLAVAEEIGKAMNGEKVVLTKSTVPVGTAQRVREAIELHTRHRVHICSNPEFLKEGAAVEDFMKPDRVVIGTESEHAKEILRELYAPFVRTGNPIVFMDLASAELTKYAANAMLATRISFMNEVAQLCERVGADVDLVRYGLGTDRRIGPSFLFPGVGYGGSCFPKDVRALVRAGAELGCELKIVRALEAVNEAQKRVLLEKIDAHFGRQALRGRLFAIWGLSFKPETDDLREAPSIVTVGGLLERGAVLRVHDPQALANARQIFGDRVTYCPRAYDALEGAEALVIMTEWLEYRRPDFQRMKTLLKDPVVFDGRNLYDPERMEARGFTYHSVGRRAVRCDS